MTYISESEYATHYTTAPHLKFICPNFKCRYFQLQFAYPESMYACPDLELTCPTSNSGSFDLKLTYPDLEFRYTELKVIFNKLQVEVP